MSTFTHKIKKSKDRKQRQRKRGCERQHALELAYEESKKALGREKRFKKALERENKMLQTRLRARCDRQHSTLTKATNVRTVSKRSVCSAPSSVRLIPWKDVEEACISTNLIGKGVFANCFVAQLGVFKTVCIKLLTAGDEYKSLFYAESKILSDLCHFNLPWIHGLCNTSSQTAIVMTHHPYDGKSVSMHVHDALHKCIDKTKVDMTSQQWKQVLLGCSSALVYLSQKNILHNDIKSDNVLIERLLPQFVEVRAVLIDFNKACICSEARKYSLTSKEKEYYAKHYPQIAPEVRCGYESQSLASDIYSMGRIIQKINATVLNVPCVGSLAQLCLSSCVSKRPSATELNTTFANLFL